MIARTEVKQGPPKEAEKKLQGMTEKKIDKRIRESTPFFWGDVDLEPKTLTVTAKVSKTIADLVISLAAEDVTTKSSEAASLLAEGIWARLERVGTSSPTVEFHLLRLKLGARDKIQHDLRVAFEALPGLPARQAAGMGKVCRETAAEWDIPWPPALQRRRPLDGHISKAFRELVKRKVAANQDDGRVTLRDLQRKTGRDRETIELAMARDTEVEREEGAHRTVWYSLKSRGDSDEGDRA